MLLFREVVGVDLLHFIGGEGVDADIVINHKLGELFSVDQDDFCVYL